MSFIRLTDQNDPLRERLLNTDSISSISIAKSDTRNTHGLQILMNSGDKIPIYCGTVDEAKRILSELSQLVNAAKLVIPERPQ